jgi:hypothetical protein
MGLRKIADHSVPGCPMSVRAATDRAQVRACANCAQLAQAVRDDSRCLERGSDRFRRISAGFSHSRRNAVPRVGAARARTRGLLHAFLREGRTHVLIAQIIRRNARDFTGPVPLPARKHARTNPRPKRLRGTPHQLPGRAEPADSGRADSHFAPSSLTHGQLVNSLFKLNANFRHRHRRENAA